MEVTYEAKSIKQIDNGKGYWDYEIIGIYEIEVSKPQKDKFGTETTGYSGKKIGEYKRNYHAFYNTFCPFQLNNKWYALYSKEYMYTRVMSLPDCKDLGGEDSKNTEYKNHFCPVDYYVPILCGQSYDPERDPYPYLPNHDPKKWCRKSTYPDNKHAHKYFSKEEIEEYKQAQVEGKKRWDEWYERNPIFTRYADFGFIGGCAWGDDSSWKIEFLDLSKADKGVIKRDNRFGYIEMPGGVYRLKDLIDCDYIDNLHKKSKEEKLVTIGCNIMFDLETGEADPESLKYITQKK